jgi:hypothetical protein
MKTNVDYIGKYLKRPPIGETRIKEYDGKLVTYEFLDHYTDTKKTMSLPVLDFIARLVSHIHDKHFRAIRYYGFLSNRNRGKLLPKVQALLGKKTTLKTKVSISWRDMIQNTYKYDPLRCRFCKTLLVLKNMVPPLKTPLLSHHKEIAHGAFPLLL